jgi:hypothetical protein
VLTVDAIARQVEAEGATKVVVLSDDIAKYDAIHAKFPAGTEFHGRDELDAVQRRLREMKGVTVLIYEQTCAAEKRRRRKKGELMDPARRLFINDRVCEGCGDCSVQSNCVAVLPLETELGRKRKIDQSSCNKDYSCAKGFCPSFVGVIGGQPRKRAGALGGAGGERFAALVGGLPQPPAHRWTGPYDLLVTGVGGTGVVTVGALIAMAAHLEGHSASVLDFMGFAQKGGSVLSFVRLAKDASALNQVASTRSRPTPSSPATSSSPRRPMRCRRCAAAARGCWRTRTRPRSPSRCRIPMRASASRRCSRRSSSPPVPTASRPWTRRRWPRTSSATPSSPTSSPWAWPGSAASCRSGLRPCSEPSS